ncbi:MAG: hypothetical protein KBONHNOK_00054 [Candidatus Methanoperedenaceae archaeon GB50]|nr:MAG: hypothetical protein KBONHNOK_00054 [Candidatus Methanoperedenaceae archaeon GB50]
MSEDEIENFDEQHGGVKIDLGEWLIEDCKAT